MNKGLRRRGESLLCGCKKCVHRTETPKTESDHSGFYIGRVPFRLAFGIALGIFDG